MPLYWTFKADVEMKLSDDNPSTALAILDEAIARNVQVRLQEINFMLVAVVSTYSKGKL